MKPKSGSKAAAKSPIRERRRAGVAATSRSRPARQAYSALVDDIPAPKTETISASVPVALVHRVRARIGKREFSQFVTRSIERELVRLNRLQLVEEIVAKSGELDPVELAAARRLIRGN